MAPAMVKDFLYFYTKSENENLEQLKEHVLNELGLSNLDSNLHDCLILHSFNKRWLKSFDFLISLPIHDESTVLLDVIASTHAEYDEYAMKLIEKGAIVQCTDSDENSLLHYAITHECGTLAQILIEKGVDINAQNIGGDTPLHSLIIMNYPFPKKRFCGVVSCVGNKKLYDKEIMAINVENVMELLEILLSNGADPSICNIKGYNPFDLAMIVYSTCENRSEHLEMEKIYSVLEILYHYTYDEVVPCHIVLEMIKLGLPLLNFDEIREITIDSSQFENMKWSVFSMDIKYLKTFLEKFDHVIVELLHIHSLYTKSIKIENFDVLLHSPLAKDVYNFIKQIRIVNLIEKVPGDVVKELIQYLLSYGLEIYEDDLEAIYNNFGRCDLFTILLYMDVEKVFFKRDLWLSLLYNFHEDDMIEFLRNPNRYNWKNVAELLCFFSGSKLKDFFQRHLYFDKQVMDRVERLPRVPLLQELARNAFRPFFIEQFNIKTPRQFYTVVKCLPISATHEKIITLEQKLYY